MTDYPTPQVTPLDPNAVAVDRAPALAAYYVAPNVPEGRDTSSIRFWMTVDPDEHFDAFLDTLTHEIEHDVLFRVVGEEACRAYDNIDSPELPVRSSESK